MPQKSKMRHEFEYFFPLKNSHLEEKLYHKGKNSVSRG